MPPKSRSKEQFNKDKEKIVNVALKIIEKQGLESLTMRKLGSKMGMSAANMYNYFFSKDELYLHILTKGFMLLDEQLEAALTDCPEPLGKLERYLHEFIDFGMKNPAYYNLMMSTQDPKAMDYTGTPAEELANYEKKIALKSFYRLNEIVSDCQKNNEKVSEIISSRIICELHGVINLLLSNIIREIGTEPDDIIQNIIHHILSEFN